MIRYIPKLLVVIFLSIAAVGIQVKPTSDPQRTELFARRKVVNKTRYSGVPFQITPHDLMDYIKPAELDVSSQDYPSYPLQWYIYQPVFTFRSTKPKPSKESFATCLPYKHRMTPFFIYTPKATCTQATRGDILQAHF